jgi:hypothetical protein
LAGVALAALVALWFGRHSATTPATSRPTSDSHAGPPVESAPDRAPTREAARANVQPAALLMAGPGPGDNRSAGAKPHPLTLEHARLHHEVILIDDIYTALEAREFDQASELLSKYRELYKGMSPDLDEGLGLLLECMQHPSAEARAHAQQFFDTETYSTARRRIKRWCLDQVH